MRIGYVARHGQKNNDDEGAITYALNKLGHTVICIPESHGHQVLGSKFDVILFHKWKDYATLGNLTCPSICWFFDEVHGPWVKFINNMSGAATLVALTDGKYVERAGRLNMHHVLQGADERVVPYRKQGNEYLLYIGDQRGPRKEFVNDLSKHFPLIIRGQRHNKVYKEQLGELIAGASLVVAPSTPVYQKYWSNRAYLLSAYGAVVVHAKCDLIHHYEANEEMLFYSSQEELFSLIRKYHNQPELLIPIREAAIKKTHHQHLYRHRLQHLLSIPFYDPYLQTK